MNTFFRKLFYKLILKNIRPEIIPYKDHHGKIIENTRVSILSHLSNKSNLKIGKNVFIGHFNYLDGFRELSIDEGCQITNYVSILTHSSHHSIRLHGNAYIDQIGDLKGLTEGSVKIGAYSYIGAHCTLMPGTEIGKGSIVSAYSFVNGSFPDYSILRGQPAKVIGDTRSIDDKFLAEYPDLQHTYYLNDK